ncbi:MAG: hypothetical protein MUC79_16075, partial [Thiobacillaceae bacterium]|nr:hypothetical protein [Thiobacillaceae bacterium]
MTDIGYDYGLRAKPQAIIEWPATRGNQMAIFRCNKCAHLAEVAPDTIGTTINCPQCGTPTTVYDTSFFVRKLLERYFALQTSLKRLQAEADNQEASEPAPQQNLDAINIY